MLKIKKRLIDSTNIALGTAAVLIGMVGSVSALHILDNTGSRDTAPKPVSTRSSTSHREPSHGENSSSEPTRVNLASTDNYKVTPASKVNSDCENKQSSTTATQASTAHEQPQTASQSATANETQIQPTPEQQPAATARVNVDLQPVLSLPLPLVHNLTN